MQRPAKDNGYSSGGLRKVKWDEKESCWYVRPSYRDPVTGEYERRRHQVSGKLSEREAQQLCDQWLKRQDRLHRPKRCGSLGEECLDWIRMRSKSGLKHRSVKDYERAAKRLIMPRIGGLSVDEVDYYDINNFYDELIESGREDGKGLSPSSLSQVHAVLRGTFDNLTARGIIVANPMRSISRPRGDSRKEAVSLSEDDAARLYTEMRDMATDESAGASQASMRDRNMAMAVLISLATGMRCGEVCALRRCDFVGGSMLVVEGTVSEATNPPERTAPKTAKSRRNVSIEGGDLSGLIAVHLRWQESYLSGIDRSTPIITVDGDLIRPSFLSKWFSRLKLQLDLPSEVTFHSLRHTMATQMIQAGEDMRTVSERLGHASVEITLSIYAHKVPGRDQQASVRWMQRIGGAL